MVMQSVIEEKSSRILEVLVSTVRPCDMMMGKILGVAAVAVTQIAIWGVLIILTSAFVVPAIMPDDILANVQTLQAGGDIATIMDRHIMMSNFTILRINMRTTIRSCSLCTQLRRIQILKLHSQVQILTEQSRKCRKLFSFIR